MKIQNPFGTPFLVYLISTILEIKLSSCKRLCFFLLLVEKNSKDDRIRKEYLDSGGFF
jgi:hypothetical protein